MTTMGSSSDDIFILDSIGDYRGGQGADTYILTNQIPASAFITITDKEGLNKIQLADGLVIASSKFLSNAAELTLSNGAIVRILGASSFTFDIGANTTTGDVATNPNSTYAEFAKELGAQIGSTTGTSNYRVPITIPTFSIATGDTFSTIAAGNVSGFSASGVSEGSNATFTVKLSVAQTTATTVNYTLAGTGTPAATVGTDTGTVAVQGTGVTATGGTLTFAAGITTATISVPVTFDTTPESGEGIILTLSSPSSGVLLGTDFTASKEFLDSTAPRFSMSSTAVSGTHTLEGSAITFTITPEAVLTQDIKLSLDLVGALTNGTVPTDFYIASPEVIFNAGNSLLKTITVNVANDIPMEGVESYTAVLVDTKTGIQKAIPIIGTINDSANVTGPVFLGAEMDPAGSSIDLIYNEALGKAATETTSPFAFVIQVGANIVTPSSVTVSGSRVKLNLVDAIIQGQIVTIDYIAPSASAFEYIPPTASALTSNPAIQDILGNDAFSIVKIPVKNNSTATSLASRLTLAMDSNFNSSGTASTVSLKANSPISTIFNATSATGIKQIIIDGTKAEVAVNNLATLATVELYNQPFGNLSVAYAAASPVVTNASDVQRLTVSNVGSTDSVAVAIDKVESLILVSTNYPNKVGLSGVTAATTIAVEGDKALTITNVPLKLQNFNAAGTTASIDANLSLGNGTLTTNGLLSVQGGEGADTITVDAVNLNSNALISGNGSADTLFINSGATATPLQPRMSTVETLKIGAITGDLVFKGDKTTDLKNLSLASTLGANVNLENLTTSNFTVDTYGATTAKTVTVTNIGTETLNYIAESTSFDNNNKAIFKFSNANALTVNVGKNVTQNAAITADQALSITLNVASSITLDNPTELTSFAGSLIAPKARSLTVSTSVPGSATLVLANSILPTLKTLTITGGGSVSMKAAQYNLLETITAAGTDTIILFDIGDVTAKAGIEKYDLGSIGSIGRKITIPSEVVAAVTIKGGTGADTITLGALGATITVDDSTVVVTGGAGADNVTFLNTLALADTLSFDGGIGTDSVVLPAFANTITLTNVETITATAGLTAQTITVAGTSAVALAAGAGVQNILSTNTALTTITDAATTTSIVTGIATGTGGYSINTGVLNSAINFSAMTGIAPMTIALNAGGPTAVTITEATATNTGTTTLTGGATTQTVTVTGGATAHTFTSTALSNINYTAVTAVTAQAITTGAGNDIIAGGGGGDSINVGNGTNSVTVANKADLALLVTLVGGTGTDTLTITAPTTAIADTDFTKTTAFNTLVLGAATTATLDTLFKTAGFTSITGSGFVDALTFGTTVAPVVSINGGLGADTIATGANGSTLTIADTDGIAVTGGAGVDAITFITSITATTVTGNLGADVITLGNFTNTLSINDATIAVTGGTGIDTINFITTGLTAVTVTGDTGADVITLGNFTNALSINDSTVLVTGNAGVDTITLTNTAALTAVTIDGATGADSLAAIGNFANNSATFTDMDSVTLNAITADSTTGAFTIAGTTATTVAAPAGNSIFASTSTATTTITATATKTLALSGTGAFAVSGMTSGAITSTGSGPLTVTGGAAATTVTSASATTVTQGAGQTLALAGTGTFSVSGGTTGTITSTGSGALTVTSSANAQRVTSASATTITANALTGVNILTIGGTGNFNVTGFGTGTFTGVGGLTEASSHTSGSLTIEVVGTSVSTITLDAAGTGTVTINDAHTGTVATTLETGTGTSRTVGVTLSGATGYFAVNGAQPITITASAGSHSITGGLGADTITGGAGVDTLAGGGGGDVFNYSTTALLTIANSNVIIDLIDGGVGALDELKLTAALGSTTLIPTGLDLSRITNVEKITAGPSAGTISIMRPATTNTQFIAIDLSGDTDLTGTNVISNMGANAITTIIGSAGIDTITLGDITLGLAAPSTTVNGGAGADTLSIATTNTVTISDIDGIAITGTATVETIIFSVAVTSTTVTGDTGADVITLGNFTNTLSINDATIAVTGGTGIDTINFITTGLTAVTVTGDTGADVITLGNFTNALSINDSTVLVTGNAGVDTITLTNTAALTAVTIDGATGADSLAAIGNFANNSATFTDMDSVTLNAITADSTTGAFTIAGTTATTVAAPAGNSIFASTSTATTTITATATKTLALSGTGAFAVSGMTSGAITSTGSGPLTVTGGAAATTVTSASATTVTQGAGQTLALAGTGTFSVSGGTTGTITSTGSGALTVTSSANAQTVTSASATTVNATSLNAALTIGTGSTGNFTVTGLGNAANSSITETGTPSGTLTVTTAGNNPNAILEAGGTGAVIINVVGAGLTTLTGLSAHTSHTATMGAGTSLTVDPASTALSYGVTMTGNSTHAYVGDTNTSAVDTIDASAATGTTAITGGLGNDIIKLGGATDTVIFAATLALNGADTITAFTSGTDKLNLDALTTTTSYVTTASTTQNVFTTGTQAVTIAAGSLYVVTTVTLGGADTAAAAATAISAGALWTNATTGNIAYFVVVDNNSSSVWSMTEAAGTEVETAELTLMGTIDATLVTGDIVIA